MLSAGELADADGEALVVAVGVLEVEADDHRVLEGSPGLGLLLESLQGVVGDFVGGPGDIGVEIAGEEVGDIGFGEGAFRLAALVEVYAAVGDD